MPVDDEQVQQLIRQMHERAERIPIGTDPEELRSRANRRRFPVVDVKFLSVTVAAAALIVAGVLFTTESTPSSSRPNRTVTATTAASVPPSTLAGGSSPTTTVPSVSPGGGHPVRGASTPATTPPATVVPTTVATPSSSTTTTSTTAVGPSGPSAAVTSVVAATSQRGTSGEQVSFTVTSPTGPFNCSVQVLENGVAIGSRTTATVTPDGSPSTLPESLTVPTNGPSFDGDASDASVVCTYSASS